MMSGTGVSLGIPESVRAMAEQGLSKTRENYDRLKEAAESNNLAVEAALGNASIGVHAYLMRALDMAKSNAELSIDFVRDLMSARAVMDAVDLWNDYLRRQMEALTDQSRELAELGQKIAVDTVEPIKSSASKAMQINA